MNKKLKQKKIKKSQKVSYLNVIRKITGGLYGFLENLFKPNWVTRIRIKRGKLNIPLDIAKMNRLMKTFYHRPEMKISDATGLEYVNFKAKDGLNISGVKFKCNPDSKKWVVVCHWFGGQKFWALYNAIMFRKMGYNILAFDFRGHGKSDNDTTTMGAKEIWDLMGAIEFLNQTEDVEHIATYGISMGAFCVSYLSVYDPEFAKKNKVKYGICDSDYESVYSLLYHIRNTYVRFIPRWRTKQSVIKLMEHHNNVEKEHGIDLFQTGVKAKIETEGHMPAYPILFMHSQNDAVTSPIDSYRSFSARAGKIEGDEIWTFQYGTHALMTKEHFKDVEEHIGKYIAKMDGTKELYKKVAVELKLSIQTKKEFKQHNLV
jgi:predicted alpha/beta-fold hydrolase